MALIHRWVGYITLAFSNFVCASGLVVYIRDYLNPSWHHDTISFVTWFALIGVSEAAYIVWSKKNRIEVGKNKAYMKNIFTEA